MDLYQDFSRMSFWTAVWAASDASLGAALPVLSGLSTGKQPPNPFKRKFQWVHRHQFGEKAIPYKNPKIIFPRAELRGKGKTLRRLRAKLMKGNAGAYDEGIARFNS